MYKVRILIDDRPVKQYHDRQGNLWVEARYGTKYAIEVKNDTWKRALAVVSVDGLNVINGKREEPIKSTGYVINPYNNVIIKGWRISSCEVKEFYFTAQEDSYSKKLGANPQNIGVIGAVIYEEAPTYTYTYAPPDLTWTKWSRDWPTYNTAVCTMPVSTYNMSSVPVATASSTPQQQEFDFGKIATGSGEKVEDHSHKVHFGTKVQVATINIYYDTKANLLNRGIIRSDYYDELPKPFPQNGNYCPDV